MLRATRDGIHVVLDAIPGVSQLYAGYRRGVRKLALAMPKGLYQRSLIIIIAPIVLLQAVVAFVVMEQHWQTVTRQLSAATTRDIAALVAMLGDLAPGADNAPLFRVARDQFDLTAALLPPGPLPQQSARPFFTLLDETMSEQLTEQVGRPFWIDTVGASNLMEVRIALEDGAVLQVFAPRSQSYTSPSYIFILWMVGTSLVLLTIAILFLRNQILPIQRLADAAESFGKGRPTPAFKPRGAREVRQASAAFLEMRERIARQMEQRTAMLAGVSHDLRTVLTRFRLQLELLDKSPDVDELHDDIDDMQAMLEGYLAFASGDGGEQPAPSPVEDLLLRVAEDTQPGGCALTVRYHGAPTVILRPLAFRRCIGNLARNACRHGRRVAIEGVQESGWLTVTVDDDGPGVPAEEREKVFRPFYRLDAARNLDQSGTGLGLAIARDIARIHGGDITLGDSPLGGLRATVRIPG
ncbi:MAG: two-component sensor histidine kinase [Bauldia sp.]|nr:two-component sensor histidine kinase [Bauldia sp.]